jgi:hypothetical protein
MENDQFEEVKAEIRERYPETPWVDVYTNPIWYGRNPSAMNRVEGRYAIIGNPVGDLSNQRVYCVASDQYKIVRPEEALYLFENSLKGYREYGKPTITIRSLLGGAKWTYEALFPEKVNVGGREINPKAGMKNSLDLGWEFSNWFGAYWLICSNGVVAGHIAAKTKKKHRLNLDVAELSGMLTEGMAQMSEQFQIWDNWASRRIEQSMAEDFMERLTSITPTQREKIVALPLMGRGESVADLLRKDRLNVLDFHDAVTQYFTHEVEESVARIEREEKFSVQFHREAEKLAA